LLAAASPVFVRASRPEKNKKAADFSAAFEI
jgi:hypothetical protein